MKTPHALFATLFLLVAATGAAQNDPRSDSSAPARGAPDRSPGVASSLPPRFANVSPVLNVPAGRGAWAVKVVTRGGIGGRELHNFMITSTGDVRCGSPDTPCGRIQSVAAARRLARMITSARPSAWGVSSLGPCLDCYATLLILNVRKPRGIETSIAYWDVTTGPTMAVEPLRLYDAAVTLRNSAQ